MTDLELKNVELLLWKSIAASRERQNVSLAQFFDVAIEIANFWRSHAPDGIEYPAELAAKIEALPRA